jgi:hypothetical protein
MLKRMMITSLALASMLVGPGQPASAQSTCTDLVLTRIYSDATHTEQVGYIYGECSYPYIRYYLVGTYTYFQADEVVGQCGPCGPIE